MQMYGMMNIYKLAQENGAESGEELKPHDFELWTEPADDGVRRERGIAAYEQIHGAAPPPASTAFQGRARLDYLYGEAGAGRNISPAVTDASSPSAAPHQTPLMKR